MTELEKAVRADEEMGRTFEALGVAATEFNGRLEEAARQTVAAINGLTDKAGGVNDGG